MADVKWIKVTTDIFDNRKIKQIESMPDGDVIIVIWFKLLCLAGMTNDDGLIYLTDEIPFNSETLSTEFNKPLNTVKLALSTFEKFGMIEIIDDFIKLSNWEKYQNVDGLEKIREQNRLRKQRQRDREKQKRLEGHVTVTGSHATDIEEDIDIDIDIDSTTPSTTQQTFRSKVVESWNTLEEPIAKIQSINSGTVRYNSLKARVSEQGEDNILKAIENIRSSSFLKGKNDRGWIITFDWFIKPNNFVKVLEGNYLDKKSKNTTQQFTGEAYDRMSRDELKEFVENKMENRRF